MIVDNQDTRPGLDLQTHPAAPNIDGLRATCRARSDGRFAERARHDSAALLTRLDGQDAAVSKPSAALVSIHNHCKANTRDNAGPVIHSRVVKKAKAPPWPVRCSACV
jgi:hypothetical protein